ncbi:hypothetical protein [Deinococcus radiopugnans]|uniref:hypothetical protein n=1 Tax=Deinococcus radiopugnans TaxID=57497 RepID=UPI0012E04690|nr:hypothetical protein [Deinococcus radiopugnans]
MPIPLEKIGALKAEAAMKAAMGKVEIPGLERALDNCPPVPSELPARHLNREEFLQFYLVPWLAQRLLEGEAFNDIVADYKLCVGANPRRTGHLKQVVIVRAILAINHSEIRDLLEHDDDVLAAVVWADLQTGYLEDNIFKGHFENGPAALKAFVNAVEGNLSVLLGTSRTHLMMPHRIDLPPILERLEKIIDRLHQKIDLLSS